VRPAASRPTFLLIEALGKSFGAVRAVDQISLSVGRGETLGLLGPNGAGKSTTLKLIAGLLSPDSGFVSVGSFGAPESAAARAQIGIAPQELALYSELTAEENLMFFAQLQGMRREALKERVEWALALAGLEARRRERVRTFSGGMQRRLNLACAVVHSPQLVLLDEPTVGVDPQSRNRLMEALEVLRSEGTTIIYSTHHMEEAARLCDRVAIIDQGSVLACDTVQGLIRAYGGEATLAAEFETPLPAHLVPRSGRFEGGVLRLRGDQALLAVSELARAGFAPRGLALEQPSLESVFLALTGRTLRD
jgi:ABC-2 type transport system ATP-binding protein